MLGYIPESLIVFGYKFYQRWRADQKEEREEFKSDNTIESRIFYDRIERGLESRE